jgi:hypothetical protein
MGISPGEVTDLLLQLKNGNRDAQSRLLPLVYAEECGVSGSPSRAPVISIGRRVEPEV